MRKSFSIFLILSILFIFTSCFSKKEPDIEIVKPNFTISSGTGGGGGTPSAEGGTRK